MITVRVAGERLPFPEAESYDYVHWGPAEGGTNSYKALTLFNADGDQVATFYNWDGVDAGDPS